MSNRTSNTTGAAAPSTTTTTNTVHSAVEFERPLVINYLPYGHRQFRTCSVSVDPLRHSAGSIKEKIGATRGLLIHAAQIVEDEHVFKNWYDGTSPVIVIYVKNDFEESDDWHRNPNQVARLLNAGVVVEVALTALGRAYWHDGFEEFFTAASILRSLVDASHPSVIGDYQRRIELLTCTSTGGSHSSSSSGGSASMPPKKEPRHIIIFNEHHGGALLPPILQGDIFAGCGKEGMGGKGPGGLGILEEWIDVPKPSLGADDKIGIQQQAQRIQQSIPALEIAATAVVRVFGYHAVDPQQFPLTSNSWSVVPFTAFFISPKYLLTTRTAVYCEETGTFATHLRFTKRQRAIHGMLHPDPPYEGSVGSRLGKNASGGSFTSGGGRNAAAALAASSSGGNGAHADREGDLHELRIVPGLNEFFVQRIRQIGVNLEESHIPPTFMSTAWNDVLLLEVVDPKHYSPVYLLPAQREGGPLGRHAPQHQLPVGTAELANSSVGGASSMSGSAVPEPTEVLPKGTPVYCVGYPSHPSDSWLEANVGPLGHNAMGGRGGNTSIQQQQHDRRASMFGSSGTVEGGTITMDTLRRQFWSFDVKCCAVGEVLEDVHKLENILWHSCSVLPGMRGAPLLEVDSLRLPPPDSEEAPLFTFSGIQRGRSLTELQESREHIIGMSTSEVARLESLSFNMRNEALPSFSMALILLYQHFVVPSIKTPEHRRYLKQLFAPFDIFVPTAASGGSSVSDDNNNNGRRGGAGGGGAASSSSTGGGNSLLSVCHRKMLKDAEDQNEYGMDFYDHLDLNNALCCFREGAKMFSTATIPNLGQHEIDLRTALQTNVSAVIVAKMSTPQNNMGGGNV